MEPETQRSEASLEPSMQSVSDPEISVVGNHVSLVSLQRLLDEVLRIQQEARLVDGSTTDEDAVPEYWLG